MIDGVELVLGDQAQQMRELEGDDALGLEQSVKPATKSLMSGTCASTLLPAIRSASPRSRRERSRQRRAEELDDASMPLRAARLGDVARRARRPAPGRPPPEVLQQVAVVAGNLDDQRLRRKVETGRHGRGIGLGMLEPGFRIAREVGVVLVEVRRRLDMRELNQPAGLADHRDQRVEALPALRHVFSGTEMVGNGRQPEVSDDLL